MNNLQNIKKMIFIAIGFGLATYLIMSGMAMLEVSEIKTVSKQSS